MYHTRIGVHSGDEVNAVHLRGGEGAQTLYQVKPLHDQDVRHALPCYVPAVTAALSKHHSTMCLAAALIGLHNPSGTIHVHNHRRHSQSYHHN